MNVLCLGCSFTSERSVNNEKPNSWVKELAKLHPEHIFFNCASPGSSLFHSIYTMENFLSQKTVDKIVFQITTPGRLTYYRNLEDRYNVDNFLDKRENNYYWLKLKKKLVTINPGTVYSELYDSASSPENIKDIKFFGKEYYERFNSHYRFGLEHKILIDYIRKKTNFVFFHLNDEFATDFISIESLFGNDFTNYCADDGFHLNNEGLKIEAAYLDKLLFS